MNETTTAKRLGLIEIFGILLFPYICAWFTLRQGVSTKARVLSFGWMALALMLLFQDDRPSKPTQIQANTPTTTAHAGEQDSIKDKPKHSSDLLDLTNNSYDLIDINDGGIYYELHFSNGWMIVKNRNFNSDESGHIERFTTPNSTCIGYEKDDKLSKAEFRMKDMPIKRKLLCVAEADFSAIGYGYKGGSYEASFKKGDLYFQDYSSAFSTSPNYYSIKAKG